jgi:hypothetical protein
MGMREVKLNPFAGEALFSLVSRDGFRIPPRREPSNMNCFGSPMSSHALHGLLHARERTWFGFSVLDLPQLKIDWLPPSAAATRDGPARPP